MILKVLKFLPAATLLASAAFVSAGTANAEMQLSVYSGVQGAPHSDVSTSDGTSFTSGWEGKSTASPPYYGVRGTWWLNDFGYDNFGLAIDFSHTKAYSTKKDRPADWTHFEFTDGLNLLTANVFYRHPIENTKFTPYVGLGIGADIPHVELTRSSGKTWNYQVGGVSGQFTAGLDYKFTDHISAFGEYKLNYSRVDVDIDSGATLKTNLLTNAFNVGVTYKF